MSLLRRSLVARLLTYLLLLVGVPLAIIGYVAYESGRQTIVARVGSHLESVTVLKQQEIENWVQHLEHTLTWLAADPRTINDAAILISGRPSDPQYSVAYDSLTTELRRIVALGDISPVFLLDNTDGQIIASSDVTWEGKFGEGEEYFNQGKMGTYVSEFFYSLSLGHPTMVVSTPVTDVSGQLLGVLAADASLEPLNEVMLEHSGLGETGETYLVNKDNLLLTEVRSQAGQAFKKWVFTEGVSRALAGKSGVALYQGYRGVPVIGAYHWIEDRGLSLMSEVDQAEAFVPMRSLRNTIALLTTLVLVCAAGLAVLLSRRITRPISKLADYAKKVGKGDYTAEAEIAGEDEVAGLASDVKAMVKQLLQMQEKLLASERLATLGQFSGNISHELRNPLGVIDSSAYYLKTKLKDSDEKVHEHLDRIRSSVSNSTAIIESLLNLTRMKAPELRELDLTAVIHDALATSKLSEAIETRLDFPEGKVLVDGDHEQLRMAFKNIIKNAKEAMETGGTLTVTIHKGVDGWAEVFFTDTGAGIAAEDLNRVFHPLFSRKAKGIGFGLSITEMVIVKHGGAIEAKSEPGKGATFVIRLPLREDKN